MDLPSSQTVFGPCGLGPAMLGGAPGPGELLVVFIVVLVLFGPRRLPQLARTLGRVMEQLRRASQDFKDQIMRLDEAAGRDGDGDGRPAGRVEPPYGAPPPGPGDEDRQETDDAMTVGEASSSSSAATAGDPGHAGREGDAPRNGSAPGGQR